MNRMARSCAGGACGTAVHRRQERWGYGELLRCHTRILAFGAMLMVLSSFGQTFFISLFGAAIRDEFGLTDGLFGALYGLSTLCSAATLALVGHRVDSSDLHKFTLYVAGLLAAGCALLAASPNIITLALSLYLLRLTGQGLMVHTAVTMIARALPGDRGKGIGVAALGLPLGEAVLPLVAVSSMELVGWRPVWAIHAGVVLLGAALALSFLPKAAYRPFGSADGDVQDRRSISSLLLDARFTMAVPLMMAAPFVTTGFFFHQARLAEEKSWSLSWIAVCFVAYAIARAGSLLLVGPLIDRFSAVRIFPLLAIPQAVAMVLLIGFDHAWIVPAYLVLFGLAAAMAGTLGTALWAEIYGSASVGRVRGLTAAASVVASGAAPACIGLLIDEGVPLSWQAAGMLGYVGIAGLLALVGVQRTRERHSHGIT